MVSTDLTLTQYNLKNTCFYFHIHVVREGNVIVGGGGGGGPNTDILTD
jgi:hypothetical protein